jgi:hypothetical protein
VPGQRGTEKRVLNGGQVMVRLPPALAQAVRAHATAADLTEAAWVRRLIADAVGAAPVEAVPVRPYQQAKPLPSADVVRLAGIQEVLAEATGALKKSAIFTREQGASQTHALLEGLIPIYRQHADDMRALKKRLEASQS